MDTGGKTNEWEEEALAGAGADGKPSLLAWRGAHSRAASQLSAGEFVGPASTKCHSAHLEPGSKMRLHYFKIKDKWSLVGGVRGLEFFLFNIQHFSSHKVSKIYEKNTNISKKDNQEENSQLIVLGKQCLSTTAAPVREVWTALASDSSISPKSEGWSYCHLKTSLPNPVTFLPWMTLCPGSDESNLWPMT